MNTISPLRNAQSASVGFYLANFALIVALYYKVEQSEAFLCIALGFLLFGFSLKRTINHFVGIPTK